MMDACLTGHLCSVKLLICLRWFLAVAKENDLVLNLLDKIYVLGRIGFARLWWGASPVWAFAQQPFCDGLLLVKFAPRVGLWCWSEAHSTTVRCFACFSAHCLWSDACAGQVVCLRCMSSWTCAQHNSSMYKLWTVALLSLPMKF
jgi:hypothetical protein